MCRLGTIYVVFFRLLTTSFSQVIESLEDDDDDASSHFDKENSNNVVTSFSNSNPTTSNNHGKKSKKGRANPKSKEKSNKKHDLFKNNVVKNRHSSAKSSRKNDLNIRRTKSEGDQSEAPLHNQDQLNGDVFDHRSDSIGPSKSRKRGCVIL